MKVFDAICPAVTNRINAETVCGDLDSFFAGETPPDRV